MKLCFFGKPQIKGSLRSPSTHPQMHSDSLGVGRDDTIGNRRVLKSLFTLFLLLFLTASCNKVVQSPVPAPTSENNYSHTLMIGGQNLLVEIATSTTAMEQGLSDRESMQDNQGMLFDFGNSPSAGAFWMKDMKFGLDFIWITEEKIVGITSNVLPPVNCQSSNVNCLPLYYPPSPVNQVLEVNAGWAEKNKIKTGDQARLGN